MSENEAAAEQAPQKAQKHVDHELSAMRKIGAILQTLSDSAQRRVVNYYAERTA